MKNALAAAALAAALAAAAAAHAQVSDAAVDPALVSKIETTAVLPPGASKLTDYDRYYGRATMAFLAADGSGERDVIAGVWLKRGPTMPRQNGAVPVPGQAGAFALGSDGNLPLVSDGGCSVLTLYFDLKTQAFLFRGPRPPSATPPITAVCNGVG
ncbi:MAG: hypothetical protein ABI740_00380 [Alphaproteobacteria bacterium]